MIGIGRKFVYFYDSIIAFCNDRDMSEPIPFRAWVFFRIYLFIVKICSFVPEILGPVLKGLGRLIAFVLVPDIPASLSAKFKKWDKNKIFWRVWLVTFSFCLVGNLGLSIYNGTLIGSDPHRLYFARDLADLLEYAFVCPFQVAFVSLLVITFFSGIGDLDQISGDREPDSLTKTRSENRMVYLGLSASIATLIALSSYTLRGFMAESLSGGVYLKYFWYVEKITQNHGQVLGFSGRYYAAVNFALEFMIFFAMAIYLRIFIVAVKIGKAMGRIGTASQLQFDQLKNKLMPFTKSYAIAKILAFLYLVNWFTWQNTQPHHSLDVLLYGAALSIFGLLIVPAPRYFIQMKWHQLFNQKTTTMSGGPDGRYRDIRCMRITIIAEIVDIFLSITFIYAVFRYYLNSFIG